MIATKATADRTMQGTRPEKKKLTCDQVSWITDILNRLQSDSRNYPMVSRQPEALKLAALLEIMDIFGYEFEDNQAAGNAPCHFNEFDKLRGIE